MTKQTDEAGAAKKKRAYRYTRRITAGEVFSYLRDHNFQLPQGDPFWTYQITHPTEGYGTFSERVWKELAAFMPAEQHAALSTAFEARARQDAKSKWSTALSVNKLNGTAIVPNLRELYGTGKDAAHVVFDPETKVGIIAASKEAAEDLLQRALTAIATKEATKAAAASKPKS